MSKDYKLNLPESTRSGSGSSLLIGILIGLVLGLGIALGVAWYINKMPSPFRAAPPRSEAPAKSAAPEPGKSGEITVRKAPEPKPRFEIGRASCRERVCESV